MVERPEGVLLIEEGRRIAEAFARELDPDQRGARMARQFFAAATEWCASGARWNLADAVREAGLDDRIGEEAIDVRALDYLAALTGQLGPLATTPAALHWAAAIGVEPWLVLGLLRREGFALPAAQELRVPWEVIRRINRWSLALVVLAFPVCEAARADGPKTEPERVRLDWPLLWNLRDLAPHPLALDPETARAFVDACTACDPVVQVSDCLLEGLWWEGRFLDSVRAIVERRPLSDSSMAGQPKQWTAALDEYPRDAWAEAVLTAAAYWVRHPERMADEMAELMAAAFSGGAHEPLPPVFRLRLSDGEERWQRVSALLEPLLRSRYAERLRAVFDLPDGDMGEFLDGRFDRWARVVLFESILREAYGAMSALVCDPLRAMERTRLRAERLLGPLDRPLGH